MKKILNHYHHILNENNIKPDQAQEQILELLAEFHKIITKYLNRKKNIVKALLYKKTLPKGLYLHGNVGTGKSIIMDMFFENLNTTKKHKTHFHSFMLEVRSSLHKFNKATNKVDPLKQLAKFIRTKYQVLYIDELYINDITDAMIVGKLFKELIDQKIIIIITSNFMPNDLYKDGLQREAFIPFIKLIEDEMQILSMNSEYDYRANKLKSVETTYYIYREVKDSQKFILDSFKKLSNNVAATSYSLDIDGRELICPVTALDCAVFTFDQLCRAPLAVTDYIEICQKFNIIILAEIPELSLEEHNELRRFIHLIDTIYEFKRLLICSAKSKIESIYQSGKWHFEFSRTASRLHAMQSEDYLSHHIK